MMNDKELINKKVIPAQAGISGGYRAPDPCLRRDDSGVNIMEPDKRVLPLAKGESEGVGIGIETPLEFTAVSNVLSYLSIVIPAQAGILGGYKALDPCLRRDDSGVNVMEPDKRVLPLAKGESEVVCKWIESPLLLRSALFFLLISLSACIGEKKEMETPDMDSIEILPEVVFSVVDDEPLNFFIESRGVVEPIQKITITPRISGFVEAHTIEDGKVVHEGDVLVQFNKEEWELAKQEAYNQYLKAKSEYDVEMRLRGEEAAQNGEGSGYRITTGLADAEVAYERAKLNLSYTTVPAPFSGVISTKEVLTRGAYISAGKELGSLIDTRKVRVRFDVLESEITGLNSGIAIELEDPSGTTHEGSIVAISPEIDQETKTGQVIAEVNNTEGALKPGMTVEGRVFVRSETSKVRMPRESLIQRDGRTLVFRLHGDEVEWIYVTPVAMTTDWVLIDHPDINPGDTLAVDKHFAISHQQRIIPLMANTK